MADEADYTQMWSGVYTAPPTSGDYIALPTSSDEGFYLRDGEESPHFAAQKAYAQGSRRLDHSGKVTSARAGRSAVDDDPHYATDAPNQHSHMYLNPEARGPALYNAARPIDHFGGHSPPRCRCSTTFWSVEIIILVVVVAVFVATCLVDAVGRRIGREVETILRRAGFTFV